MGDGGVVAAGLGLGGVGGRGRERTAEGVDDLIVAGAGEVEGDLGGDGGGVRVHVGTYAERGRGVSRNFSQLLSFQSGDSLPTPQADARDYRGYDPRGGGGFGPRPVRG